MRTRCYWCGRRLHWRPSLGQVLAWGPLEPPPLCPNCRARLSPRPRTGGCRGCGRPGPSLCPDCCHWQAQLGWLLPVRACYAYNQALKEYMHAYKFSGDYRLRHVFQAELTTRVKECSADLVVPVPVSAATLARRGFNQVAGLLACSMASVLVARPKQVPQSAKGREERLATPQPFILPEPDRVQGQRIVVVDDVYTTGRTLYHAASLLRAAGCQTVCGLVLAN